MNADYDGAIEHWGKVAELEPGNADIQLQMGGLYLKHGDIEKAQASADKAAALDQQTVRPQLLLGTVALRKGDYEAAASAWVQARERDPNFALTDVGFIRTSMSAEELAKLADHARRSRNKAAQEAVAAVQSIHKMRAEQVQRARQ